MALEKKENDLLEKNILEETQTSYKEMKSGKTLNRTWPPKKRIHAKVSANNETFKPQSCMTTRNRMKYETK